MVDMPKLLLKNSRNWKRKGKVFKMKDDDNIFSLIAMFVLIAFILFCIFKAAGTEKGLSNDEICQKHFGKDYVWHNGYRSPDFCVGDSGIPKYPKSWKE